MYYFLRPWFILDSFFWTLSPVSIAFYIEISGFFTLVSAEHPPIPAPLEQHKGCLGTGGVSRLGDPAEVTANSMNLVWMWMLRVAAQFHGMAEEHTGVNSTLPSVILLQGTSLPWWGWRVRETGLVLWLCWWVCHDHGKLSMMWEIKQYKRSAAMYTYKFNQAGRIEGQGKGWRSKVIPINQTKKIELLNIFCVLPPLSWLKQ